MSLGFVRCSTFVAVALLVAAAAAQTAPKPAQPDPAAAQRATEAASEAERQREMQALGIASVRPGVDSDPRSSRAVNYDESKADASAVLPDPLLLANGKRVTTAAQWWSERRPQIVELFDREIYGRTPAHLPKVTWRVLSTTREKNGSVEVVTKELRGHVDNSADPAISVEIELTVSTPADAKGPVPVILELGFSKEFLALMLKRFLQFAPKPGDGPTWQQQLLARGWGYAEYVPTSVQADNGAGLNAGIIGLANHGQPRSLDDWGALKAWAWGASRCFDYFETDPAIDAKRVGITGHSRYGKASLVAMAYDPRWAIGYISSSGEAGAKLFRHRFGEELGNVAAPSEFHWMAANFMRYDSTLDVKDLPVDAHELIALAAPRPVFIGAGSTDGDGWADARGMFLAEVAAGPVYTLLGKKDLGITAFPPIETALVSGDLGFRQHTEGHTPAPNWPTFLDFAAKYFDTKK